VVEREENRRERKNTRLFNFRIPIIPNARCTERLPPPMPHQVHPHLRARFHIPSPTSLTLRHLTDGIHVPSASENCINGPFTSVGHFSDAFRNEGLTRWLPSLPSSTVNDSRSRCYVSISPALISDCRQRPDVDYCAERI
jgi:hypothetical protein